VECEEDTKFYYLIFYFKKQCLGSGSSFSLNLAELWAVRAMAGVRTYEDEVAHLTRETSALLM
jgi:hypothetical protein